MDLFKIEVFKLVTMFDQVICIYISCSMSMFQG
jgi:hypothetical protein